MLSDSSRSRVHESARLSVLCMGKGRVNNAPPITASLNTPNSLSLQSDVLTFEKCYLRTQRAAGLQKFCAVPIIGSPGGRILQTLV